MSEERKTQPESSSSENAIVGASNTGILKLDVDCLEELFEWLSLRDLQSLRQTCRRMKQVVNYHIKVNYPLRFGCFEFLDDAYDDLCQFDATFTNLYKTMKFEYTALSKDFTNGLKHVLSNVNKIIISDVQMDVILYDDFLQYCTNLKSLVIVDFSTMGIDTEWLLKKYPTLENFTITDPDLFNEDEKLKIFLEQNQNIRSLALSSHIIDDWMLEADVKLDKLEVEVLDAPENGFHNFCNLLNSLHAIGFYKRLHLFMYFQCEHFEINEISHLRALEVLFIENFTPGTVLSPMNQLKVFYMHSDQDVDNMEMLVDNLANVEKVHFKFTDFESILPFFHRSTKLKEIKINTPASGRYFSEGVIDLVELNKERRKCSTTSKLTIYVGEQDYLATKFAKMKTQFDLIEIKRAETNIFEHEH